MVLPGALRVNVDFLRLTEGQVVSEEGQNDFLQKAHAELGDHCL